MADVFGWIIMISSPLTAPVNGSPYVVFIPGQVLNVISLPNRDEDCILLGRDAFTGSCGRLRLFDNKELQDRVKDCRLGIVRVFVDLKKFPPSEALSIFRKIRAQWDPKIKTVIFVHLCWEMDR